jgi:hypothetical protein
MSTTTYSMLLAAVVSVIVAAIVGIGVALANSSPPSPDYPIPAVNKYSVHPGSTVLI